MDDELWRVTPAGFEQTKTIDPGCDAYFDTMDDIQPSRRMTSLEVEDSDAILEYLKREAEHQEWRVDLWDGIDGFDASKRVDGRRWTISFAMDAQSDGRIELVTSGSVAGLRLCHRP